MSNLERKKRFIKELASFLVGNEAGKSVMLQMEHSRQPIIPFAKEWASLRSTTPLMGYLSVEEAEKQLQDFLL